MTAEHPDLMTLLSDEIGLDMIKYLEGVPEHQRRRFVLELLPLGRLDELERTAGVRLDGGIS